MDGQRLDASLLQLFSQGGDDELLVVPSQTGLDGDRYLYGLYHLLRNLQQLGNILQHAGTGPFASHLLDRTAEVKVDDVRSCLFNHLCSFDHRLDVTTIDLDAYGTLLVGNGQFPDR